MFYSLGTEATLLRRPPRMADGFLKLAASGRPPWTLADMLRAARAAPAAPAVTSRRS